MLTRFVVKNDFNYLSTVSISFYLYLISSLTCSVNRGGECGADPPLQAAGGKQVHTQQIKQVSTYFRFVYTVSLVFNVQFLCHSGTIAD
jgi:hypothetical protein